MWDDWSCISKPMGGHFLSNFSTTIYERFSLMIFPNSTRILSGITTFSLTAETLTHILLRGNVHKLRYGGEDLPVGVSSGRRISAKILIVEVTKFSPHHGIFVRLVCTR